MKKFESVLGKYINAIKWEIAPDAFKLQKESTKLDSSIRNKLNNAWKDIDNGIKKLESLEYQIHSKIFHQRKGKN